MLTCQDMLWGRVRSASLVLALLVLRSWARKASRSLKYYCVQLFQLSETGQLLHKCWIDSMCKGHESLNACLNNLHKTTHLNSIMIPKSKFSYFLSFTWKINGNWRGKWFTQDHTVYAICQEFKASKLNLMWSYFSGVHLVPMRCNFCFILSK